MSVIAISGVPPKWNIKKLMLTLVKVIRGKFEILNIANKKNNIGVSYIRLSERLDPKVTVEHINRVNMKLRASIPYDVPELIFHSKPKGIPNNIRRAMHIPNESTAAQVLLAGVEAILQEIQSKYTGLYDLSKKGEHKLLQNIAKVLCDRLRDIMQSTPDADTCFKLTKHYRKVHPHFGDFQLILTTLHKLEDAEGRPRTQLNKQEFSAPKVLDPHIDNVPFKNVQQICTKYSNKIAKKIKQHVNNLKTDINESNPEEAARKKVREGLKKLVPYLPRIITQVVTENFVPQKAGFVRLKIYGEPLMPPKHATLEWLQRHRARACRCERAFNLLRCAAPRAAAPALFAADGCSLGGATLYIRSAEDPYYRLPDSMKEEIMSSIDNTKNKAPEQIAETEQWNEDW